MAEPNQGLLLGRVQYQGHLAIDQTYAALADAVERSVLEQARNGLLSPLAVVNVLAALRAKLGESSPLLLASVTEAVQRAAIVAQQGHAPLLPSTPGQAMDLYQARAQTFRTIQASQQNVLEQTGARLLKGATSGLTAKVIANQARQYFSPFFATRRDAQGKLLRDREGAVTSWPGQAGMASTRVRLVMLDQTGRVHAGTTLRLARRDNLGLQYNLSYQHRDRDECTFLRWQDVGYGLGVYHPDDAPAVPRHPRCRCYYSTTPLEWSFN